MCAHEQAHTPYTHMLKANQEDTRDTACLVKCLCHTTKLWVGSVSLHTSCVAHNLSTWETETWQVQGQPGLGQALSQEAQNTTKEAHYGASNTLQ